MAAREGHPPEVADILRNCAPELETLGADRRRAVRDITRCRTAALGGHLHKCDECGHEVPLYNSCRNRHCPKCQSLEQARWVERQMRDLLPGPVLAQPLKPESWQELYRRLTGRDPERCPVCARGTLRLVAVFAPTCSPISNRGP